MDFKIISNYKPTGDQPEAIKELVKGIQEGEKAQTLLGVTGSGKTFTIANVIQEVKKPTLVLSHNKTLVAQLYGELKQFFPDNAIEYFVSYYDYYQPEAYLPVSGTYIEKDLSINEEIEKLRLRASTALLSGRRDVIVVASVSCIYGIGNPTEYENNIIRLTKGDTISRSQFLYKLVDSLYSRTEFEFTRGTFRVKGDTIDIFLPYAEHALRLIFFGDELESLELINPENSELINEVSEAAIFPANLYMANKDDSTKIIYEIQDELRAQIEYFENNGKHEEAKRLKDKVNFDLEMIRELGYCSGIENYSRFLDRRNPGDRPFCLIDYFPDDYLLVVDESHVTLPQVRGMHGGDRSRKMNLVEYGFRLPSALDNRPLNFDEFQRVINQSIYVSATPGAFELEQTGGAFVEQIIRPTGLLEPIIEVKPCINQIDDLLEEIDERIKVEERVLVTTLTKRMAEELAEYLADLQIKCRYIHSEVDTLERVEILRDLRLGKFDVLIGVNLLREGLDLPEVSLVAILDADKEGFLRSEESLTQISGRAARNVNGKVIMYADTTTGSMQRMIDQTNRKREKQLAYNQKHNITPQTIFKTKEEILKQSSVLEIKGPEAQPYIEQEHLSMVADPILEYMNKEQLQKTVNRTKKSMEKAAQKLDFLEAARLRDEMYALEVVFKKRFG